MIAHAGTLVQSTVMAGRFILALGGIETVRLLLNAEEKGSLILGRESKYLGKYFMNHPKSEYGFLELFNSTNINDYVGTIENNLYKYIGLSLPWEVQEKKQLLNAYIRFEPIMLWSDDKLVSAVITFLKNKRTFHKIFLALYQNKEVAMLDFSETGDTDHLERAKSNDRIKSISLAIQYLFFRITNKKPNVKKFRIRNYLEMEPRYENQITLSNDEDSLGNKKAHIEYSLSNREKQSILTLHDEINQYLQEQGIGRLNVPIDKDGDWPIATDASHHMGGTIMGTSSDNSFVDPALKVHSKDNLYISSSSTMPTGGSHNPTYTIAALSCMLVDHL
ncbi:GMC family oxidoreductase [Hahella ganghwensis]|uniref:GMC family oxidoreductase n=1 Tax=Hahella ganghwensis TaxID=286420 RepID=UPI0003641209|nr:GMC oxidoreductase [Hahella ganghwensis]